MNETNQTVNIRDEIPAPSDPGTARSPPHFGCDSLPELTIITEQMHTTSRVDAKKPRPAYSDLTLLHGADKLRARVLSATDPQHQKRFGQFLTPPHVADLMASMFQCRAQTIRLLDAGAGLGMLSASFVHRLLMRKTPPARIEITAYELDKTLITGLRQTITACLSACQRRGVEFMAEIRNADFIAEGTDVLRADLLSQHPQPFNAAIVNPPYGKLSTSSPGYRRLRAVGLETTNFYTGFLDLIIGLLGRHGEIVAITPRSFCNGPYFKPFRKRLLGAMSVRRIHTFVSRQAAFKHDNVLQENIILHAVKDGAHPRTIQISQSEGRDGGRICARRLPAEDVVIPADPQSFIHIPTSERHLDARDQVLKQRCSLDDLGLVVSTGRVVDFRAREHISQDPQAGTCPLIYPCHFNGLFITWPSKRGRKPNAIRDVDRTHDLLIPAEVYVLTKRFTSKEERRRVVACILDPSCLHARRVGLENHLNYFHASGKGLDMPLAKGLWAYLNSSILDLFFRQFNGHTQVNATDLRHIRFPTARQLRALGARIAGEAMGQQDIDTLIGEELKP